jgi:hypothetical protein
MIKQKEKYRQFKKWQHQPHQVAPLSEETHECATCGTRFEGNYCPRCGQSAKIGRYSFKKAFLLFLDVWGVGNRGMFRSIRDLIFRPGYMIRDYLRGMQMAYFPPFKMLFLLCTLSLLVESGLNIQGVNYIKQSEKEFLEDSNETQVHKEKVKKKLTKVEKERQQKKKEFMDMLHSGEIFLKAYQMQNKYLSLVNLAFMLLFSVPLYLMFRHSPAIPDLRFSECFVTMVYITNMITIYDIFFTFLSPNETGEIITASLFIPLFIIPIKQLSGYSYWSTIWRTIVALIPFAAIIFVLFIVGIFIYGYIYINY